MSTSVHPFDQKKLPCQIFFVTCVSVFGTRGSLISTIWGLGAGFYIPSRKDSPSPGRRILLPGCGSPEVWLMVTIFWICE
jgi:hypothetical protein